MSHDALRRTTLSPGSITFSSHSPQSHSMSSGNWTRTKVGTHPVEAWVPTSPTSGEAILFLHDLDALAPSQHADWRGVLEASPVPVICPLAGRTWWLSLPTAEFPEGGPLGWVRSEVVPWIEATFQVKPPRMGVVGIGMGGGGALNLAYRSARQFPVVAAISAAVDFHVYQASEPALSEVFESVEAARQETATLHLHPLNWPLFQRIACHPADPLWFDGCERLASKLGSSGIPFDSELGQWSAFERRGYESQQLRLSIEYVLQHLASAARQLHVV